MNPKQKNKLIEDALDAACIEIQLALGVTEGDLAGLFFNGTARHGDDIRAILSAYIDAELRNQE